MTRQTANRKVGKVLIVGQGASGTQFFLENLYEVLKLKLLGYNVETAYEFSGYKGEQLISSLPVSTGNYDAILKFQPTSEEKNPIVIDEYSIPSSNGSIYGRSAVVRFTQNFKVSFFIANNQINPLWEASLTTNLDSRDKNFYTKIADDIIRFTRDMYRQ